MAPSPYYQDDWVTIYHGDCREIEVDADVLVTDPPYGVALKGKATKHTTRKTGGYPTDDDPDLGPSVVRECLPRVERGAVWPGIRQMFRYPNPTDVGCIYCPSGAGIGRWGFTMYHPILFYGRRPTSALMPTSRQSFTTSDRDTGHPCPKPMEWLTWLVQLTSLSGETLLDPFAGTGTTLAAAKSLGRYAIGIEIEERYCEVAAQRCSQEVLPLEGAA